MTNDNDKNHSGDEELSTKYLPGEGVVLSLLPYHAQKGQREKSHIEKGLKENSFLRLMNLFLKLYNLIFVD